MRWGLLLCLVLLGCHAKSGSSAPDAVVVADAQLAEVVADSVPAGTACNSVTDTACCVDGKLQGQPCVLASAPGKIICPAGGFPCNMMYGNTSECGYKCIGPDGRGPWACNQAEKANLCCCNTELHTDPVCGNWGKWMCPASFQLYSGADCNYTSGPCSMPLDIMQYDLGPDAGSAE